ncbi:MAG: dockerin type I domain-containing protein [Phycisphaerae bacterium]|jgi:hypothetical protein
MKNPCWLLLVSGTLLVVSLRVRADDLSIHDIQFTIDPAGASSLNGAVVNCRGGIVTHKYGGYRPKLTIQDPNFPEGWGAIQVKDGLTGAPLYNQAAVGDWVRLINVEVEEFRGNTILQCYADRAPDIFIISHNNPLPSPIVVTLEEIAAPIVGTLGEYMVANHLAEPYEAMRLRVENVKVIDFGLGKANDNYVLQSENDPNLTCWAADYMNSDIVDKYHPLVVLGRHFCAVEGIIEQYTNFYEGFDYYQLITTATTDFTLPPSVIAGNLNQDCIVNFLDMAILAQYWLRQPCTAETGCSQADFDANGIVDFADLNVLVQNWLLGL